MRRPAQHTPGTTAAPGWTHPYTGPLAHAVFYNDGGDPASQPSGQPVPSPADVAARAGQQQPPNPVLPPAGQQRPAGDDDQVLRDHRTGEPMTQATFTKIMAKENAKGRRAALRELAESAGIPFTGLVSSDPDEADVNRLVKVLKDAETDRQAKLSEEQRRNEELTAREQAIEAQKQALAEREAEAARRDRDTRIRAALVSLGATGDDLDDATRLINVPDDANDEAIQKAATELKERRGVLFGGTPPQTLPPAPSGGPAGGNTPRPQTAGKDAIRQVARQRAIERGLRSPDAA